MTETKAAAPPKLDLDATTLPEKDLPEVAFPGAVEREYRVVFEDAVHAEITKHSAETVDVELAGILVGELRRDRGGPYLAVTGSIRGEFAENEGAQVKLTHATWDHVHKVKDEKFPKAQIVGWYHTHPGFGVFLSSMDVFIHEFFFNHAPQVALVVDPRTGDQGIFVWQKGKIERAPRFWVGSAVRACATGPVNQRPGTTRVARPVAAAPGSAPMAQAPASGGSAPKDEDELDVLAIAKTWFAENWMLIAGFLLGFLVAKVLAPLEARSLREDAYRAEVRSLLGSTVSAYATQEDLQRIDVRLEDAAALASGSGAAQNLPRLEAAIHDLRREVAAQRATAHAREVEIARALQSRADAGVTLEEQVRALGRDCQLARAAAIDASLAVLRLRLDAMGGKLSPQERESYRAALEPVVQAEGDPRVRDALRARFPEIFAAPPAPQGPQAPGGK